MRGMMESTVEGENMFHTAADDCLMKDLTLECSYISCHFINRIFPRHNSDTSFAPRLQYTQRACSMHRIDTDHAFHAVGLFKQCLCYATAT